MIVREKLRDQKIYRDRGGYRLVDGDNQSVRLPADVGGVGVQQECADKAGQQISLHALIQLLH